MGVDYNAHTYVGIGIVGGVQEHFYEKKIEVVRLCGHPEAKGKRYCPECGRIKSERTREEVSWELKPEFAGCDIDLDDLEYSDVAGLKLYDLRDAYSGESDGVVLGLKVGDSGSSRSGGGLDTASIDCIDTVKAAFERLGIDIEPKIFTYLAIW